MKNKGITAVVTYLKRRPEVLQQFVKALLQRLLAGHDKGSK